MKLKSIFLSSILIGTITLVPTTTTLASVNSYNTSISKEMKEKVNEVLVDTSFTRGRKPPSGSSFVNLTTTDYTAKIEEMKISVFTNSLFKGSENITINIDSVDYDRNGFPGELKGVFVQLYEYGTFVDNIVGDYQEISLNGGSATFSNLDANKKYYVEFFKQSDQSIYKFSAKITD